MGSPLLNIRALCYLTLSLTAVPAVGSENTLMPEVDVGLKLILNYSEAAERLKILDKRASFRTGGAGIMLSLQTQQFGTVFTSYGAGYSPNEDASFVSANISGPATSTFFSYGYQYLYPVTTNFTLGIQVDHTRYIIEGDFKGDRKGVPVEAKVTSKIKQTDLGLSLHYQLLKELRVEIGIGTSRWQIDALAEGLLNKSIKASTKASAKDKDPFLLLGLSFNMNEFPVQLRYKRGQLSATNTVDLHALDLNITLPF